MKATKDRNCTLCRNYAPTKSKVKSFCNLYMVTRNAHISLKKTVCDRFIKSEENKK